ncbi:MAG: hypothetical protein KGL91_06895 [Xanthomonadaceae bacterium]|nr:hypothetical protein [Xanthomonadaceae bacterium]
MTKLVMQQAPTPAMPRRFLLSASLWGMVAGVLLVLDDGSVLASRWNASTLVLVHVFTLGVLGNAMFGSLLQFLPVAVQVRVRGGHVAAALLHALLNAGAALLVVALRWPALVSPHWGGVVLGGAFLWLLAILLPGLWAVGGQRFLRWGMGCALLAALVTAGLGVLLVLGLAGTVVIAQPLFTDVHAGWGVLGWVLGLLAAVARVVAPMFQGAGPAPQRAQGAWQIALYGLLLAMLVMALAGRALPGARIAGGLLLLAFALGGLLLQLRAAKLRIVPLLYFWRCGLLALASAALVLLASDAQDVLAGVLVLAIGLPLLVTGMQLEITGFLGWIELQRRCGRGVHLPGVQWLVPARDKWGVLGAQLVAGLMLVMACLGWIPANGAGLALLLAHAAGVGVQLAARWRANRFFDDAARRGRRHG